MPIIYREETAASLDEFLNEEKITLEIVKKKDTYCLILLYTALRVNSIDIKPIYVEDKDLLEALRVMCQILSHHTISYDPPTTLSRIIEVPSLFVGDIKNYLPLENAFIAPFTCT